MRTYGISMTSKALSLIECLVKDGIAEQITTSFLQVCEHGFTSLGERNEQARLSPKTLRIRAFPWVFFHRRGLPSS